LADFRQLHRVGRIPSVRFYPLETEVGVQLLARSARGVELTAAGRAFLEHARLVLAQAEAAIDAARLAAYPAKPVFALGFLTGQEMDWLPEAMRVLRDVLPDIEVTISSQYSPLLADALTKGKLDLAFMRAEPGMSNLTYHLVAEESLVAVLPSDHRLAGLDEVDPQELAGETFIAVSKTAPTLRAIINEFISQSGLDIHPRHEVDNLAMAMSLIASTRGVALLPAYAKNFIPWSVISRPLAGDSPKVDLVIAHSTTNTSPTLRLFLSRIDDLLSRRRMSRGGTSE
jgi:LysR family transcriptional regulator, hca operon transcriptional activator